MEPSGFRSRRLRSRKRPGPAHTLWTTVLSVPSEFLMAGGHELQTSPASTVPTPTQMTCLFTAVMKPRNATTFTESQAQSLSPHGLRNIDSVSIALNISECRRRLWCRISASIQRLAPLCNRLYAPNDGILPQRSLRPYPTLVELLTHPRATDPLHLPKISVVERSPVPLDHHVTASEYNYLAILNLFVFSLLVFFLFTGACTSVR